MPANRPAPLMAVLAILSVACVGESGSVVEGSPTADLAVAVPADGSELPAPTVASDLPASAGAWMDAEPDVTATQGDAEPTVPLASAGSVTTNVRESGHVPDAPTDEATVVRTFPAPTATTEEGAPVARLILPEEPLVFTRPEAVRGIYLNGWASGSRLRSESAIALAKRTEINSFVIDLKDVTGYVSHPTQVMFAREVGADQEIRIRDLVGLLARLHEADIYPIARIVIVKDPVLVAHRPELAVQDTSGGVWVDDKSLVWANMYDRAVWDYHIALAKEAVAVGFPEIQWDYLRFPDASKEELNRAWYPGQGARKRSDAVREFLQYAREELGDVTMTADVFGISASVSTDVGIGQLWEDFIDAIDVALPMVYPSHYSAGNFGIQDPSGHPYEIVKRALGDALERSAGIEGAGTTRPWLQDFTLGAPAYGAPEVRAQIEATYDAGIDEWILWNPSSRYTEAALAPSGGYPEGTEPVIRVGGRIVPLSQRAEADSLAAVMVRDTSEVRR